MNKRVDKKIYNKFVDYLFLTGMLKLSDVKAWKDTSRDERISVYRDDSARYNKLIKSIKKGKLISYL